MNKQEKLAREWAEKNYPELVKVAEGTLAADLFEKARAAAEYILAHTTPDTMADVEWDHDTMPGTGALTKNGRLWIMRDDAGDAIDCISTDLAEIAFVAKEGLTPNGKRYKLVEVPDHPEVLKTVKDYANAPEGTLAASSHGEGYFHNETMSRWESTHGDWKNYVEMESSSHSGRTVLRWGWGEQA